MNSFGTLFKITLYGASHQEEIGIIIDNVKPGLKLDLKALEAWLELRKPTKKGTTLRKESDKPIIKSGYFNGLTTGSPLVITFKNENTNASDYQLLIEQPRPSHADLVNKEKYLGFNDHRGGGASSGRMTVAICAAGYIASLMKNWKIESHLVQVGTLTDLTKIDDYLKQIEKNKDSVGAIIEIAVKDCQKGLGEPFFQSVESQISALLFSIPGVKAVEFGAGFKAIDLLGSEYNDLIVNKSGKTKTNNDGGINGGITNSNDLIVRVFLKPSASIGLTQETYNFTSGEIEPLTITGRHDTCYALRAPVILESAVMIALTDLYLLDNKFGERNE
ncbi:MAG: chorismate synthase [Erysipelotrichales bacterium]|nr:chorismate synthase [Erysipelotrichales bacterium]